MTEPDLSLHPVREPHWKSALRPMLDLMFPAACPLCSERLAPGDEVICAACRSSFQPVLRPRCPICGRLQPKMDKKGGCQDCPPVPVGFDSARGAFLYRGAASDMVKCLKFGGRRMLGPVMGRAMVPMFAEEIVVETGPVDFLIPVPLHIFRYWWRGFNQSLLICNEMSRLTDVPVLDRLLQRVKYTRKQSLLDPMERYRNVRNAFAVTEPSVVRGKRIVLVDDVYTTGATINACALVLREAGAESVNALTFARA